MNEYNVSDYQIFSNGVSTTNAYGTKISDAQTSIKEVQQVLSDGGVFMGPIQENCAQEFGTLTTDMVGIAENFTTISGFIDQVNTAYQSGDADAAKAVLLNNVTSAMSAQVLAGGTMREYDFNGTNFNVVNTKGSIEDYEAYLQKYKIFQNEGVLGGQCMMLSQYYAKDLLTGKYTSKSTMQNWQGSPATRINERAASQNPQDVLDYTYSELQQGHPVVLQVTQKKQGLRHLVTAVGYDSSVTSASDLTPDKILVLDCVDGKIQRLSDRGRQLFKTNNYQALGPTEAFLNQEVNVAYA